MSIIFLPERRKVLRVNPDYTARVINKEFTIKNSGGPYDIATLRYNLCDTHCPIKNNVSQTKTFLRCLTPHNFLEEGQNLPCLNPKFIYAHNISWK